MNHTYRLLPIASLLVLNGCARPHQAPPSTTVTVATGAAKYPTAAVDPRDGTTYFAWIGQDNDQENAYLARLAPGATSPSAPVRVNDQPGDAYAHAQAPAQVVVGPEGTVYVAWTNKIDVEGRRFPASNLRFARSTDGGQTFEPAISVNDDAGERPSSHTFHNLTVGPDGTVYVAWLDSRERDRAQAALANGAPVPVVQASHTDHGPAEHNHAEDGLPGTELRLARSTDGGRSFSASTVVAQNTCQCCRTAVAIAADGTVYVAWRHLYDGNVRDVAVAHSTDGGQSFSTPARVHEDGWQVEGCPHNGPSLAVDHQGRIHVAWYTGAPDRDGLYYAASRDGGNTFDAPTLLKADAPTGQVRLTGVDADHILIAWEDPRADSLYIATFEAGMAIAPVTAMKGKAPAVAASDNVRAVAWMEDEHVQAYIDRRD